MNTLSSVLNKAWQRIGKPEKAAFFSATIVGLLAHITFLTNRFFNHDSVLYTLADPNSTFALQQGKWFSLPMQLLVQGEVTTPGVIVPAALLLLGLTAALTVSSLKIKSSLWASFVGAVLVLFPSVMCANIYDASAVFFSALALSALAVFVSARWKYGFLGGIALLTLSCGVYSVFIGYAAGLFILILLFGLISGETTIRETFLKGLKFVAVLVASAGLYYLILNLLLRIGGVTLMNYRGIDQMGRFTLASLGKLIFETYQKVYYFFYYGLFLYHDRFEIEPMFRALNWISILLLVGLSGWIAIRKGVLRSIGRLALIFVLALLFPLAIHLIAVLGQNAYTHWIMCYPFVLVYVATLTTADRLETTELPRLEGKAAKKGGKVCVRGATWVVLVVCILLCRQWFFTTNQAYEYIRFQNENAVAKGTMLTNDIQNTPQYQAGVPVALIGSGAPAVFQYNTGDFLMIHGSSGVGYTGFNGAIIDNERLKYLLRNQIGIAFQYVDADTVAKLSQNASVIDMPVYPEQGSIAFVGNVLVVKLSDLQASPAN